MPARDATAPDGSDWWVSWPSSAPPDSGHPRRAHTPRSGRVRLVPGHDLAAVSVKPACFRPDRPVSPARRLDTQRVYHPLACLPRSRTTSIGRSLQLILCLGRLSAIRYRSCPDLTSPTSPLFVKHRVVTRTDRGRSDRSSSSAVSPRWAGSHGWRTAALTVTAGACWWYRWSGADARPSAIRA